MMAGVVSSPSPPPAPLLNNSSFNNSVNSKISYLNSFSANNNSNSSNNSGGVTNNSSSSALLNNQSLNFVNNNTMQFQYSGVNEHRQRHHHPDHHSVPSLRIKTNELFYKWFSEADRCEQLKEVMSFIKSTNKMPKLNDLQSFRNVSQLILMMRIFFEPR